MTLKKIKGIKGGNNIELLEIVSNILDDTEIEIEISGLGTNVTIKKCRIHDSESGILISDKGNANIDNCEIFLTYLQEYW